MEQHPVPRNISGFQFHLIGDMTLRQFGYLAAGAAVGFFVYKTAPFSATVDIILALSCGFAGFAFAFLPIQERPLDKWLLSFIKSIMSPTQYLWYKNNPPPDILTRSQVLRSFTVTSPQQTAAHKETNAKLNAYLSTIPVPLHESLNTAEKRYIDKTLALFQTGSTVAVAPPQTLPEIKFTSVQKPVEKKDNPPTQKEETLPIVQKTLETPVAVAQATPTIIPKAADHGLLQNQLSQLAAEKEALEKQLQKLQQQLSGATSPQVVKPTAFQPPSEPTIKVVTPKSAVSEEGVLNYQQSPNLIAGIIKDPRKKLLPNIILTIKDKNGLPVRALKTNKLGQFSTATPLSNGTYLLEVEDPMKRYVFDIAEIALSGKVFLPIEIIAKGEKELLREKLTKELFGNQYA